MSRSKIPSFCTLILLLSSLVPAALAQPVPSPAYQADPTITTQPATTSVKVGNTATFTVAAWGATALKYQWYKNNGIINGATAAKYTTPATTINDNGAYFYVIVSDKAGSATSNYATLWVVNSPPIIEEQPASQTVTAPSVAIFQAYAYVPNGGNAPMTAQWYKNGNPVGSPTQNQFTSYSIQETNTADNGAKFTVKFTNAAGSVTSNQAILTVNPANISGTYPMVGEWTGTATGTNPDGTTAGKVQALAAFSQNAFSLTGTIVFTDESGIPDFGAGIASLNNTAVFTTIGGDSAVNLAGGFSANLLNFSGAALGADESGGSGSMTISADHNTLTGSATISDGTKITWKLTRAK